jgi:fructose-1,6-bisphosphatase I
MSDHANPSPIITIERHILDEQAFHPEATGVLTNILYDLALAGKVIASKTTRAGLAEILGRTEDINIQGETVMKLDRFADLTVTRLTDHTGRLAGLASEENAEFLPIPDQYPMGKYLLVFDPLDGSANVDFNMPVGTIFGIYRRLKESGPAETAEFLQPGRNLVASGYIAYGTSTIFVYTAGHGVHGFTLDPHVGEFLLSHPNIEIPNPKYFSVNLGYQVYWSLGVQRYTEYLQGHGGGIKGLSLRYIGTLVSDFHRNLLAGGVFYYPADSKDPKAPSGKLRLLYEAAPLAFIAEQAGGYASDGRGPILDIEPTSLHQRTPLFIGNKELVEKVEELIRGLDGAD